MSAAQSAHQDPRPTSTPPHDGQKRASCIAGGSATVSCMSSRVNLRLRVSARAGQRYAEPAAGHSGRCRSECSIGGRWMPAPKQGRWKAIPRIFLLVRSGRCCWCVYRHSAAGNGRLYVSAGPQPSLLTHVCCAAWLFASHTDPLCGCRLQVGAARPAVTAFDRAGRQQWPAAADAAWVGVHERAVGGLELIGDRVLIAVFGFEVPVQVGVCDVVGHQFCVFPVRRSTFSTLAALVLYLRGSRGVIREHVLNVLSRRVVPGRRRFQSSSAMSSADFSEIPNRHRLPLLGGCAG